MPEDKSAVAPAVNPEPTTPAVVAPTVNAAPATPGAPQTDAEKMVPLAALHEEREKFKGLRDEFDSFKQNMAAMQFQQPTPTQYPQPQPQANPTLADNNNQALAEMWETDPRKGMQTEMNMMLNWYDEQNIALDDQMDEASNKFTDFATYRNDIRKYLRLVKPGQRNVPGVVETAYFLAKGQKADANVQTAQEAMAAKIRAGEAVQGITGASSGTQVVSPEQLTQQQANAAAAMGLTPEQYMAGVKA